MLIAYESGFKAANVPEHLWDADKVADFEEHINALERAREKAQKEAGTTPRSDNGRKPIFHASVRV